MLLSNHVWVQQWKPYHVLVEPRVACEEGGSETPDGEYFKHMQILFINIIASNTTVPVDPEFTEYNFGNSVTQ